MPEVVGNASVNECCATFKQGNVNLLSAAGALARHKGGLDRNHRQGG